MLNTANLYLLTISGKNESELQSKVQQAIDSLSGDVNCDEFCLKYNKEDTAGNLFRLAAIANSKDSVLQKLHAWRNNKTTPEVFYRESILDINKMAFVFTGQGSQTAGMGKMLYDSNQIFKKAIDDCEKILAEVPEYDQPLTSILYGEHQPLINQTGYTQPTLFAFEYALYTFMKSLGIEPSAVLGHSVGEYVAASIAQVLSLENGLKLISKRAKLMQELPQNGAMVMVPASKAQVEKVLEKYKDKVSIAGVNAPQSIVISGEAAEVNEASEKFEEQGIEPIALIVSHAFHSHLLEPILPAFSKELDTMTFNDPKMSLISNLTGKPIGSGEMRADYWLRHTRSPVLFAPSIEYLLNNEFRIFVEIGTHPVLSGLIEQIKGSWISSQQAKPDVLVVSTLNRYKSNHDTILECLAKLFVAGVKIDLSKLLH